MNTILSEEHSIVLFQDVAFLRKITRHERNLLKIRNYMELNNDETCFVWKHHFPWNKTIITTHQHQTTINDTLNYSYTLAKLHRI